MQNDKFSLGCGDKLFPIKCEWWVESSSRVIRTRFQDLLHFLWLKGHSKIPKITNFWGSKKVLGSTYLYTYMYTYIHTYIYVYIHTYIHICIHTYIHTDRQTHMRTDRQTDRQTHIDILSTDFFLRMKLWKVVMKCKRSAEGSQEM